MKKKSKNEEVISWVNVHDNSEMVDLGIRAKYYDQPNFKKSDKEKELLKKLRTKNDKFYSVKKDSPCKVPVYAKLVIQCNAKNRGDNNTFSCMCYGHQIPQILRDLYPDYVKYYFNGETHFAV